MFDVPQDAVTEVWGDLIGREGATFSSDSEHVHRYRLWRVWDHTVQTCLFVMLNPSTATETKLDNTVRKCMRWAMAWGYGGLVVCNLYAYRATQPADMDAADDPVGEYNDQHIALEAKRAGRVVVAWGAHAGPVPERSDVVLRLLREHASSPLQCLRVTSAGRPWHPLYLPNSTTPEEYVL